VHAFSWHTASFIKYCIAGYFHGVLIFTVLWLSQTFTYEIFHPHCTVALSTHAEIRTDDVL